MLKALRTASAQYYAGDTEPLILRLAHKTGLISEEEVRVMRQCQLCNYFDHVSPAEPDRAAHVCAVCAVRTTPQQRLRFLRGERIGLSYMDSD